MSSLSDPLPLYVADAQTASEAAKLASSRLLWGVPFDGSADTARGSQFGGFSGEYGPNGIEFGTVAGAGHGGYIDFHYNGTNTDYTARIIDWGSYLNIEKPAGVRINNSEALTAANVGSYTAGAAMQWNLRGSVGTGGNFNNDTYKLPGYYMTGSSSPHYNSPSGSSAVYGVLQTLSRSNGSINGDIGTQLFYDSGGNAYIRGYGNSVYTPWNKFITTANIGSYVTGNTITNCSVIWRQRQGGSGWINYAQLPGDSSQLYLTDGRILLDGTSQSMGVFPGGSVVWENWTWNPKPNAMGCVRLK